MPIWATDIDGLEPNLSYSKNGIYGMGLFDSKDIGGVKRHSAVLTVGNKDKQFQLQWLLNNDGNVVGYLASRVVPEEEYKTVYGGAKGIKGLQEAFVIESDQFGEFMQNTDKLFDISRNAEYYDLMWGEIDASPGKRLFDPRGWLLAKVGGAAGRFSGQLFGNVMSRLGTMSNAETRVWYNLKLSQLNTKVLPTEANAIKLTNERNTLKSTARALMKDRKAAEALDKSDPIKPFEYYKKKYQDQGFKGEDLWKKIIESSQKPNANVNSKFGIN